MSDEAYLVRLALVGPTPESELYTWFNNLGAYADWLSRNRSRLEVEHDGQTGWWERIYSAKPSPSEPTARDKRSPS